MRKLLIITDMYPHQTKTVSGTFVQLQAEHLSRWYDVKVVSTFFPVEHKVVATREGGYELISIDWPVRRFFPLNVINYRRYALPVIRKVIRDWKPDLIHVHDCRHIPELYCLARILSPLPIRKFLTVHAVITLPERGETFLHSLCYRLTIRSAFKGWTHVFCVNDELRERLREYVPLERTSNIGNAVPPIPAHEVPSDLVNWMKKDSFKIISVGRLVSTKGFDLLIKAVKRISDKGHPVQLMIVGEGRENKNLRNLAEKLGLSARVRFTGALDNSLVRNIYGYFDVFALPSFRETFGVVYLEAMSAGIPVVGVRGHGIDGIIEDRVTGLLSLPKDLNDLEGALTWLINHPKEAKEIAEKGRELVSREYGMDSLIVRLREKYEA